MDSSGRPVGTRSTTQPQANNLTSPLNRVEERPTVTQQVNDPNPIPNAETGKPFKATLYRGEVNGRRDPARGTFYTQSKEYADIYAGSADAGGKPGNVVTNEVVANNPLVSLSKRTLLEEWSAQGDATATKLLRAKDIDFGNSLVVSIHAPTRGATQYLLMDQL